VDAGLNLWPNIKSVKLLQHLSSFPFAEMKFKGCVRALLLKAQRAWHKSLAKLYGAPFFEGFIRGEDNSEAADGILHVRVQIDIFLNRF
jgi:hypothetical protein